MSDLKDFDDPNNIAKTYEVKMEDYTGPMIYESPDGGKTVRARPLNLGNLSSNGTDKMIDYKFNEGELIDEFKRYVNSTYDSHYSKEQFQATEFIIDGGHGTGFCIGNVLKYAQRYGKKGSDKDARKDLMKVLHYTLMQLYIHDSTKST
tara:strand:+ start:15 stop:461 length:447 start_codon:yes stop_codon:yes gene_type:complete